MEGREKTWWERAPEGGREGWVGRQQLCERVYAARERERERERRGGKEGATCDAGAAATTGALVWSLSTFYVGRFSQMTRLKCLLGVDDDLFAAAAAVISAALEAKRLLPALTATH